MYLIATDSDKKAQKVQVSILLTCTGPKGCDIFSTFTFAAEGDSHKFEKVKNPIQSKWLTVG